MFSKMSIRDKLISLRTGNRWLPVTYHLASQVHVWPKYTKLIQ